MIGKRAQSDDPGRRRLPDFVVIGTMKSGTSTLFHGLGAHPRVRLPAMKEPNFFCDDDRWRRGIGWYSHLFEDVPDDAVTGEASVAYTDPRWACHASRRLARTVPEARVLCVLRHPLDRMRSHYRHEVQRGRERRQFVDAVSSPGNVYLLRSSYAQALEPWVTALPRDRLHVVCFEEIFGDMSRWHELLRFLRLDPTPLPSQQNVTSDKRPFSPAMRMLWDAGVVQRAPTMPRVVRAVGRRVLLRSPDRNADLELSAASRVPTVVLDEVGREVARLGRLLPGLGANWSLGA